MLRKMNSQVMAGAGLRPVLRLQDQYGKMVPSTDVSASLPGSESSLLPASSKPLNESL